MNTAGNDMPSNKGGNPQRRKPVRMTFNFSWFYIILIIGIIWMFFNQGGANPQKIEWTDVKEQIKAGDVKEIVFIRNDFEGRVTIKPDRLAKYADKFGGTVPSKSPHFIFLVSSSFNPEEMFGQLNDSLPENERFKLVIDEEAAAVVREIFRLRLSGLSGNKIAAILNEREIPSPAQYALNHKRGMDWRRVNRKTAWEPTKVLAILRDERYAGNMVSLRRTLNGIYGADTPVEKEEWVRVENTHEAIVSYEDFAKAQTTFLTYQKSQPKAIQKYNTFTCAHCGRKLSFSKDRKKLLCRYGEVNPSEPCYKAAYPAEQLRGAVLDSLKWHFEQFVRWEQMKDQADQKEQSQLDTSGLEKRIDAQEKAKTILYEKYRDGRLSREEYISERNRVNLQLEEARKQLEQIRMEREARESGETKLSEFSRLVQKYRYAETLTKELEQTFVEKVLVFDAEHIRITWKFEDVFAAIEAME